jgi:hypothetical protein
MNKITIISLSLIFSVFLTNAQTDTTALNNNTSPVASPAEPAAVAKPEKAEKPKKQKKNNTPFMKRLYFGGSFGATFGTYSSIRINPLIGYKITPKLSVGLKFQYEHLKNKYYSTTFQSDNYGGSIFSRFRLLKPLYLHAEYAMISFENYYYLGNDQYESERDLVPFLFLGAGYSRQLTKGSWLNFQVLFDVIQSDKSPYRSNEPFYSVGVGVGF